MKMIERVEKAIQEKSTTAGYPDGSHLRAQKISIEASRNLARAAIEAMREPTQAMIEAWSEPSNLDDYTDENCARADWQAMLDAALKG